MAISRLKSDSVDPSTERILAEPTKSFFVDMLTRDIELEDAILDLLDNCTDGVQRILRSRGQTIENSSYEGYSAKIAIEPEYFSIQDNCGGISIARANQIAFRMGRPSNVEDEDDDLYTVGTYGIGMKRALFKMGRHCRVTSQTSSEAFQVTIEPDWFTHESWELPFSVIDRQLEEDGTLIEVIKLKDEVSTEFKNSLIEDLHTRVSQLFSYVIKRGFEVQINKVTVKPKPLELRIGEASQLENEQVLAPYVYKAELGDVTIDLIVGFYRPLPTDQEIDEENEGTRYRSSEAGWTIICNDRVVVYCDRSRLTGWGTMGVPNFHTQFIAIAGVVFFKSKRASNLPLTTTKRGIDAGADLYLRVKDRMIESTKLFTNYTNKWKNDVAASKDIMSQTRAFMPKEALAEIEKAISPSRWTKIGNRSNEQKFTPDLPMPETIKGPRRRMISFLKPEEEIDLVAEYFEAQESSPGEIGALCFNAALKAAKK